jgi:lipopolysaccharide transport system permease protein
MLTMLILSFVFGRLAKLPSDGVPYQILVFSGVLPWQFFAQGLVDGGNSLLSNANMVSKIYFPRLIMPASAVIVSLVDLGISSLIMAGLMAWHGFLPGPTIFALPFFIILAFGAALGASLWLSALTVLYRDFRFIIPFMVQFGLYLSPVGFTSTVVPEQWRTLYSLNPMVGVIDGFRWCIIGGSHQIHLPNLIMSVVVITILLITGLFYFRNVERRFADII